MFELEKAITQWCQNITNQCGDSNRIDELKDHVFCEVERLKSEHQLTNEQAYNVATQQLGEQASLKKEFAKNQNLISRLCAFETRYIGDDQPPNKRQQHNITLHALIFAAAMLTASILLKGRDDNLALTISFLFIAVFIATQAFLPGARYQSKREFACLKRWIAKQISKTPN